MQHFRIRKKYDQKRRKDGSVLIGGELYTEKEKNMYAIPDVCVTPEKISKKDVCFFFGARFSTHKEKD